MHKVIAVDGYSASGKGTVTKILSEKLNYLKVESGYYYRAIAYQCLTNGVDLNDAGEIIFVAQHTDIDYRPDGIFVNGIDVKNKLKTKEIDESVIKVCEINSVRRIVNEKIKKLREFYDIIIDGRDTTTSVFPDADVKVYLTASFDARVNRRYQEYLDKGVNISLEEVKDNIRYRDHSDDTREEGRLYIAKDAIVIDSTYISPEEVVSLIMNKLESVRSNENKLKRSIH